MQSVEWRCQLSLGYRHQQGIPILLSQLWKILAGWLVAHGKHPEDRSSIMVVAPVNIDTDAPVVQSEYLEKSEAVMLIASNLAGSSQWVKAMAAVGTVAPAALSDCLLKIVADNRHKIDLGDEYASCRLDFDGEYEGRFLNDYEHEHLFEPRNHKDD